MQIIAHRGFHPHGGENTIEAFRRAQSMGADMVELDVQQTADGELVVLHDDTLEGAAVGDLSFDDIQSSTTTGVAPRLHDALEALSLPVLIEIKEADPVLVLGTAREHAKAGFAVVSFDPEVVRAVAAQPDVRRGLVVAEGDLAFSSSDDRGRELLKRARSAQAHFLVIEKGLAIASLLDVIVKGVGRPLVWGVNDAPTLEELARDKLVAGVITDRLDLALGATRLADPASQDEDDRSL